MLIQNTDPEQPEREREQPKPRASLIVRGGTGQVDVQPLAVPAVPEVLIDKVRGARRLRVHAVLDRVLRVGHFGRKFTSIKLGRERQRVHEVARPPARDDGLPFQVLRI